MNEMFCGMRIDCIICEALKLGEGIDKATMCGIGIRIEGTPQVW